MTVVEMTITSALLMVVVALVTAALYSAQSAQEFTRRRSETLGELRLGAAAFSRDARQAQNADVTVPAATPVGCVETANTTCGSKVTFDTFVAGSPVRLVEWEIREWPAGSGDIQLVRKTTTNQTRVFGGKLNPSTSATAASYFRYTEVTSTDAGKKPTLTLQLNAKPIKQDPVIGLKSKVTFRND